MDPKGQELYFEEQRQKLIELNFGIESLTQAVKGLEESNRPLDTISVSNQVKSVEVENLAELSEKLDELGEVLTKAIADNSYKPVTEVKVSNQVKEVDVKSPVTIKNLSELSKYFDGIIKAITSNQPIVNVEKQDIIFPTSAKTPISVRLSDGKRFYDAITAAVSGGTVTVRDSSGRVAVPVVNPDGTPISSGGASQTNYAVRWDDTTTDNVTYVGKATISSVSGDAAWQIKKIDNTNGGIITWADGDDEFDNVWDNRASLTYA